MKEKLFFITLKILWCEAGEKRAINLCQVVLDVSHFPHTKVKVNTKGSRKNEQRMETFKRWQLLNVLIRRNFVEIVAVTCTAWTAVRLLLKLWLL